MEGSRQPRLPHNARTRARPLSTGNPRGAQGGASLSGGNASGEPDLDGERGAGHRQRARTPHRASVTWLDLDTPTETARQGRERLRQGEAGRGEKETGGRRQMRTTLWRMAGDANRPH